MTSRHLKMHKGIGTVVPCQSCLIWCMFQIQTCLNTFLCGLLLLLLIWRCTLHQGQIHRSPHSRSAPGLRFCDSSELEHVWTCWMSLILILMMLDFFRGCWWPGHSAVWSHAEPPEVTSMNPTISNNIQQSRFRFRAPVGLKNISSQGKPAYSVGLSKHQIRSLEFLQTW